MPDNEKKDRPAKDLAVPETKKIADLLAELMPGSALAVSPPAPALAQTPPAPAPDDAVPVTSLPSLTVEEIDVEAKTAVVLPPGVTPPQPAAEQWITATVAGSEPPASAPSPTPPPAARNAPKRLGESQAEAIPERAHGKNDSDYRKPPIAVDRPKSSTDDGDTDRIPLGELTTAGYFSLVNWRNDPAGARYPRRSDLRLDEASKGIPFYVVGQPRSDQTTVAAVLSEVAWE